MSTIVCTDTLATPGPTEARAERRNVIFIIRGSGMRGPLVWLTGVPRTGAYYTCTKIGSED